MTYKPKLPIKTDNYNVGVTNSVKVIDALDDEWLFDTETYITPNLAAANLRIIPDLYFDFRLDEPINGSGSCSIIFTQWDDTWTQYITEGTNVIIENNVPIEFGIYILEIYKSDTSGTIANLTSL